MQCLELSGRLQDFGRDTEERISSDDAKLESLSHFLPSFLQQLTGLLEHNNAPQNLVDLVKSHAIRIDNILSQSKECASAGKDIIRLAQDAGMVFNRLF